MRDPSVSWYEEAVIVDGSRCRHGLEQIHVHNVGRNQHEFITAFGRDVLPSLRRNSKES
ncbi:MULTISPECIES: hypothetical protein [unclassified Sinorhizobium]|uniref:hypothetical protein n=1 Tax=unclassified Sinorhizobium TaxID=2613772 RepID=UPI0035247852